MSDHPASDATDDNGGSSFLNLQDQPVEATAAMSRPRRTTKEPDRYNGEETPNLTAAEGQSRETTAAALRSRRSSKPPLRYKGESILDFDATEDGREPDVPSHRYLCPKSGCRNSANTATEVGRHYHTDHPGKPFETGQAIAVPFLEYLAGSKTKSLKIRRSLAYSTPETKATVFPRTLNKYRHLLNGTSKPKSGQTKSVKAAPRKAKTKKEIFEVSPSPSPSPFPSRSPSLPPSDEPLKTRSRSKNLPNPPVLALPEPLCDNHKKVIDESLYQKTLLLDHIPASHLSDARNRHREEIGAVFVAARWTLKDKDAEIVKEKAARANVQQRLVDHFLREFRDANAILEKVESELAQEREWIELIEEEKYNLTLQNTALLTAAEFIEKEEQDARDDLERRPAAEWAAQSVRLNDAGRNPTPRVASPFLLPPNPPSASTTNTRTQSAFHSSIPPSTLTVNTSLAASNTYPPPSHSRPSVAPAWAHSDTAHLPSLAQQDYAQLDADGREPNRSLTASRHQLLQRDSELERMRDTLRQRDRELTVVRDEYGGLAQEKAYILRRTQEAADDARRVRDENARLATQLREAQQTIAAAAGRQENLLEGLKTCERRVWELERELQAKRGTKRKVEDGDGEEKDGGGVGEGESKKLKTEPAQADDTPPTAGSGGAEVAVSAATVVVGLMEEDSA